MRYGLMDLLTIANRLDWNSIDGGEGVIDGLRSIANASTESEARKAKNYFENTIYIQGTLFDAAAFSAPFIIAILDLDLLPPARVAVLDVLFEIGNGASSCDPTLQCTWVSDAIWYLIPSELAPPMPLKIICRSIVAAAIPVIAKGVRDQDEKVQRMALDLLGSMNGFACIVRDALERELKHLALRDCALRREIYKTLNGAE